MRAICVVLVLMCCGCTGHPFAFRGISEGQTCTEARAKEIAEGSVYRMELVPDDKEPQYTHLLFDGHLFGSPVEVRLGCLSVHESQQRLQLILDGFYIFRSAEAAPAEAYMNRVVKELSPTYGKPVESPSEWRKPDGTSISIGRRVEFGCVADERTGYALAASLRKPIGQQTQYEVTLYMRFRGGVC